MVTAPNISGYRTRLTGLLGLFFILKKLIIKSFFTSILGLRKWQEWLKKRELMSLNRVGDAVPATVSEFATRGSSVLYLAVMQPLNPLAHEFILFCAHRRGGEWPALYDEMCWVAGHRLFHDMGYTELSRVGLSFGLDNIERTIRMVDTVISRPPEPSP